MTEPREKSVLTTAARITGILAAIVALAVMLTTVLVVSPPGTPLRAEVRSVALPYFGQTWRVFAPNILKVNRTLEMRAQWKQDGVLVRSGWVSITDLEIRAIAGNAAPSRVVKSSWNASNTYLQRFNLLDEDQRERAQDTFIERFDGEFRAIPNDRLVDQLGAGDPDVIRFLRMDYMLMRYLTLYATAGFGHDIERVQWRVVRERPNDFAHRFDAEPQFEPNVTTFGWRQSNVRIEQSVVDDFRTTIERFGGREAFRKAAADAS